MSVRNLSEVGPNLQKIVKRLMANESLVKLLYYTDQDPLSHASLSEEQKQKEIFNKLIRVVPVFEDDQYAHSYVAIFFNHGELVSENTEFRTITFHVDIVVPLSQWIIKDENLRPMAIMGAIQESLSNKSVNGLGKIKIGEINLNRLTEESSLYDMEFYITQYD